MYCATKVPILFLVCLLLLSSCDNNSSIFKENSSTNGDEHPTPSIPIVTEKINILPQPKLVNSSLRKAQLRKLLSGSDFTYDTIKANYSQKDLAQLCSWLEHETRVKEQGRIIKMLAVLDRTGESAPTIIRYIEQIHKDEFRDPVNYLDPKLWPLRYLGFVGGEEAEQYLLNLTTEQGSKQFIEKHLHEPETWNPKYSITQKQYWIGLKKSYIEVVRREVAIGLMHLDIKYLEEVDKSIAYKNEKTTLSRNDPYQDRLSNLLAIQSIGHIIQHFGKEEYIKRLFEPDGIQHAEREMREEKLK